MNGNDNFGRNNFQKNDEFWKLSKKHWGRLMMDLSSSEFMVALYIATETVLWGFIDGTTPKKVCATITAREIADNTSLSVSTVQRAIDNLLASGVIARRVNEERSAKQLVYYDYTFVADDDCWSTKKGR